jgi:Putative MetA-pathway of phenol degradation
MIMFWLKISLCFAAALIATPAAAQEANSAPPDKGAFNLFNPVPENLMRELSPDRPDKTESPYTVDAGHYQLEADFANLTYDDTDGTRTKAWQVGDFNIKAGLFNQADLQLVYDNYLNVQTKDSSGKTVAQSGFGDFAARLKINLWGDDGSKTAFALLPFVKFPTSTDNLGNDAVEGGVIFPLAVKLPDDFDLGLETAVSCRRDDNNSNYHADFVNSITIDHSLVGKLSGYLEFFSDISTEQHSSWVGTIDAGLEFLVTENIQLDCGCNFGVTRAAEDFNPFAGLTVRF